MAPRLLQQTRQPSPDMSPRDNGTGEEQLAGQMGSSLVKPRSFFFGALPGLLSVIDLAFHLLNVLPYLSNDSVLSQQCSTPMGALLQSAP